MQALHSDISALLRSPFQRFRSAGHGRRLCMDGAINYGGREERLPDLDIDAVTGAPRNWDGVEDATKPGLEAYFQIFRERASEPIIESNDAYIEHWVGAIARPTSPALGKPCRQRSRRRISPS